MKRRSFADRALFIARQDLGQLLRERETLIWLLLMPVVFFYFIGTITGGMAEQMDRVEPLALDAPGEPGILAERLAARLEDNGYRVDRPDAEGLFDGDRRGFDYHRRLVLPADFTQRIVDGEVSTLRFERSSGGLANDYDRFRVSRAVFTLLADLLALDASGRAEVRDGILPTADDFAAFDAQPRSLELDIAPAGQRREIPSGFDQAVPGILVMFVLLQGLTGAAVLLLVERKQGLLRRLASTPITRAQVLTGKWLARLVMGMVQVAIGVAYGSWFFAMDWGPDFGMVLVVLVAWAGFCASAGLLVGSVGQTEGQVVGLGVLATMLLAALGGCWWPIEVTPTWMQALAGLLPSGWAMHAMHQLINFGNGPAAALSSLVLMTGAAVLLGWLGVKRFRYT